MGHVRIRAQPSTGPPTVVRTDGHGLARFVLPPGTYVVRLADLATSNGGGGSIHCGVGDSPAQVRVQAHRTVHAEVFCVQP